MVGAMLVKRIYIGIIISLILSACSINPKQLNSQPLASATFASLTNTPQPNPDLTANPSLTSTSTTTQIPTFTPSPTATQTPTSTATPQPMPPAGAYVRYFGYNTLDHQHYCGVMTVDGIILDQRFYPSNELELSPPFYCPGDGYVMGLPEWSPSGERYYFQEWASEGLDYYFFGQSDIPKVTKLKEARSDYSAKKFAPHLIWLTDDMLYYANYRSVSDLDWVIDDIVLLNGYTMVETRISGPFPTAFRGSTPPLIGSPDGKYLLLQTGSTLEETDFYLIRTADGVRKNITKDLHSSLGYEFSSNLPVHWSNDSSKFALYSLDGERAIWVIFDQDGTYLTSIDGGEIPLAARGKWTPDDRLLIGCNPVSRGRYGEYDLCLFNLSGELEKLIPYQKHWYPLENSQWSPDGAMLYYLVKNAPFVYPAKLYRLALDSGENELVLNEVYDYDWIMSDFLEFYKFTGVRWSPDGAWMILNNSGPFAESGGSTITTALICDPPKQCQNRFGDLVIQGADWWQPPPGWYPGDPLEALSPDEGAVLFEDEFSSLDTSSWSTSGAVTLTTSEYGAGLKLDGREGPASIRLKAPLTTAHGISVELKFDKAAKPLCGLTDEDYDQINIETITSYARGDIQTFKIHRTLGDFSSQHPAMPADRWLILFLRIVNQNQLQGQVIDKAYNSVLGGFNIKMEGKWTEHKFNFACEVADGVLQINNFVELEFPNP